MLKTRILTALVGIPLLLVVIYMGNRTAHIFFTLLAILGLTEFFMMMKKQKYRPMFLPGILIITVWSIRFYAPEHLSFILTGSIIAIIVLSVITFPRYSFEEVALSFTGIFYIGFFINFAILFSYHEYSFLMLLLAFLIAWSNDTGGYFFGRFWGKHKLTPQLSPKKTWEGAIGGIVTTTAVTLIFFYLQKIWPVNYTFIAATSIIASIASQIGDLMISSIKRFFGAKDSGRLIPGHGGILDRFDSFLLVLPVLYYLFIYFEMW